MVISRIEFWDLYINTPLVQEVGARYRGHKTVYYNSLLLFVKTDVFVRCEIYQMMLKAAIYRFGSTFSYVKPLLYRNVTQK